MGTKDSDEIIEPSVNETVAHWQMNRDLYWNGLSDRTRSLCLGTLVLIWSIFTEKKFETGFLVSPNAKRALLAIAASSVFVIALDLMEYVLGLQLRRKLSGESSVLFAEFDFDRAERWTRTLKVVLGFLALIALCVTVGSILLGSVAHAQTTTDRLFGRWCGGSAYQGTYTCLDVTMPLNEVIVKIGFQGRKSYLNCGDVRVVSSPQHDVTILAKCGKAQIAAQQTSSATMRLLLRVLDTSYEGSRLLTKLP
jgi:hypothetical protein